MHEEGVGGLGVEGLQDGVWGREGGKEGGREGGREGEREGWVRGC